MTISNTTTKVTYTGDGSNRRFDIPFPYTDDSELSIIVTDEDGAETAVVAAYEVDSSKTFLTFPTVASELDPLPSTHKLTIVRSTPLTQENNLMQQAALDKESLEASLDKLTRITQELKEISSRCVKYPIHTNESGTPEDFFNALAQLVGAATTAANTAASYLSSCQQAVIDCGNRLGTASQKADEAAASALAAGNAKDATLSYKNAAAQSATDAGGYKDTAGQYKEAAAASATTAQGILDDIRTRVHKEFHLIAGTADATCGYTGSLTDFEIGIDMSALAVAVYVNGILKTSSNPTQYSINTTKVVFASAVTTDDSVVISLNGNLPNDNIPDASTSVKGVIQLATNEEAAAGLNTSKAIVPASLSAVLADYQGKLPNGTTGYFLKKTSNGVDWAAVSGGGLTRFVVSYSLSTTVTSSNTGYYHTKVRMNISAAGTYLNIPDFKAYRVVLCDSNESVFCYSAGSFISISNISGNFADVYVYMPYAEVQANEQLFTSSSVTVQIKIDLYY